MPERQEHAALPHFLDNARRDPLIYVFHWHLPACARSQLDIPPILWIRECWLFFFHWKQRATPLVVAQTKAAVTASGLQCFTARLLFFTVQRGEEMEAFGWNGKNWAARRRNSLTLQNISSLFFSFSCPLCWQLSFETNSVPTIWFFFGTVNPKTDLNFKEQLPHQWTCWLNAWFSLFADKTDSVCRLLTLLRALFATYGMCAFLLIVF